LVQLAENEWLDKTAVVMDNLSLFSILGHGCSVTAASVTMSYAFISGSDEFTEEHCPRYGISLPLDCSLSSSKLQLPVVLTQQSNIGILVC